MTNIVDKFKRMLTPDEAEEPKVEPEAPVVPSTPAERRREASANIKEHNRRGQVQLELRHTQKAYRLSREPDRRELLRTRIECLVDEIKGWEDE